MGVIGATGAAIAQPFMEIYDGALSTLPGVVAALVVLIIGYIVGAVLGGVVRRVLDRTKIITKIVNKLELQKEVGRWNLSELFGLITKWYVFVVFLTPAAQVVQLTSLAQFLNSAALWIPNIILAVVIALAGYVVAEYLAKKIREVKSKQKSLLASTAKGLTLIFVALIVLRQVGIAVNVAENAFLIVLAGIMLGLALAFGLALKEDARGLIKDLRKRL
jgi:hypothetical protein